MDSVIDLYRHDLFVDEDLLGKGLSPEEIARVMKQRHVEDLNREAMIAHLKSMGPEARELIELEILGGADVDMGKTCKSDTNA